MSVQLQVSQVIDRPLPDVFQFYAREHVRNHPRWDPDIELEQMSDGPIGVGTVIRRRNSRSGTAAQLAYFDEAASEGVVVRLFASAEALDRHLQGADERSKAAYRFIEPTRIEIYGVPNEDAREMMTRVAGSGIEIRVNPTFIGGFIRPQSG